MDGVRKWFDAMAVVGNRGFSNYFAYGLRFRGRAYEDLRLARLTEGESTEQEFEKFLVILPRCAILPMAKAGISARPRRARIRCC